MNSDERGVQVHGKVSTFSTFWSWNLRTSRTAEEARKSCLTTSKSSWRSFEEFEKKLLSDEFWWKRGPSPWKSLDVFDVLKLKLAHESHGRRSKKIVPHYIKEFLEILWRIRKKIVVRWILMKEGSKSMEKSRRFRRFEVETCARVARPKEQENRASLRRRVLGNPLKNLKKNCRQIISHERVVSKVLKLKLAHESYDRRSKKIVSNYIIEFFEIHRRTRKKKFISWNERTETLDRSKKIVSTYIDRTLRNPSKNSKNPFRARSKTTCLNF